VRFDVVDPRSNALPRIVWGVASLIAAIGDALAARFQACTVRGELSGYTRAVSGHCYFTLKDADGGDASLRCAMFRRAATLLDFEPRDGQLVELRGRVALYEPRGELQFVAEAMRPAGAGALYEQYLRLKEKLAAAGLFDAHRKRALPVFPAGVGIITSLGGAALHDVLSCLARRAPHVRVVIYPSPVQGADAPEALARAIGLAGRRVDVGVLIVCRGGGSLEDLWAFNDERVVRAIVASPIPVVCGVGHETDVTLSDLAADLRAPTPTGAAELVAPLRDELMNHIATLALRLQRACVQRLNTAQQGLDRLAAGLARPAERVGRERLRLALIARQLPRCAAAVAHGQRERLRQSAVALVHGAALLSARLRHREQQLATRLHALDPMQVVARGYALIHTSGDELVTDARQIVEGEELHVTLARGEAQVRVNSVRRK
jgi:exodeoxyribonuclease VII large subunit